MDRVDVVKRTNALVAREFELDESALTPRSTLYEELGLDSLDSVDLIAAMEREFGMRIDRQQDEKSLRSMRTLEDVYAFLSSKMPT